MNTEKFTPGEWRRAMNKSRGGKTVRGLSNCRIENENGVVIAFAVPQKSRQEQVANTNLLAAAPEMYRMLEVVKVALGHGSLVVEIDKVLNKARGKNDYLDIDRVISIPVRSWRNIY
jgi:hypothetical protein